ncbi:efflux RND transporter periplasmic adaptor subunit [Labrys sp. KNU-23]|uniref:efflux RND transporter periplasmic adaptor subunit n=1 Tax=Labrys sp. KNU-23 TaxID=2789216 RepID=UPI0011EC0932|nr:efflux RND transporter periplasmic adaptor subunit [Labrys sp. KNU-23]QEN91029.1 efflux RND transporter periplasmic adaptor subunit [Labrys sp. KNU-23]
MPRLSRSLVTLAVLLAAGAGAAYLTRDRWRASAPPWLQAYLPPAETADPSKAAPARAGGGRRGRRGSFDGGPLPVLIAEAKTSDVPVYLYGVGTVKAYNTVTITPQVGGQIVEMPFREGQDVKKGDVIARIDDSTYKATLDQAIAKKAQDEALLDNAKRDLQRYMGLVASNSVTRQTADTQRSTVAQYEAQLKSDDAAIASAQATLAYTTIIAPIDGRAGIRSVDVGNVVQASGSTGLVTLTQLKPIAVLFSVPQQALAEIAPAGSKEPLQVEALRGDNKIVIDTGKLEVINNEVDASTGTIQLKAIFPNDTLGLWPGAFVNAKLKVRTLAGVVVAPTAAIQRGPNGTFVYVLGDDSTAKMRPVTVSQQGDEQVVVDTGLKNGEKIITTGFARLSDGAKVEVSKSGAVPADDDGEGLEAPAPAAQPENGGKAEGGDGQPQRKGHRRQQGGGATPAPAPAP